MRLLATVVAMGSLTAMVHAADGPALYKIHCAPCHGADGKGQTPMGKKMGAKDLAQSTAKDEDMIRQIRDGTRDKKGNLTMPSFKDRLKEEDMKAVIEFAKGFRKKTEGGAP